MTAQAERTAPVDVLIAEDNPFTRKSLRGLLERQGYTCVEAEDGPRALELALSASPPRPTWSPPTIFHECCVEVE